MKTSYTKFSQGRPELTDSLTLPKATRQVGGPMSKLRTIYGLLLALAVFALVGPRCLAAPTAPKTQRPLWVTAYYACWSQGGGILSPSEIDFQAITHLIHFVVCPLADGSISTDVHADYITPEQSAAVVSAAHAAKRPVLLCVGGYAGGPGFHAALLDPAARATLENNLVSLVVDRGYDGLDVDFEPIAKADVPGFDTFVQDMRAKLTAAKPGLLMTAAAGQQPQEYAKVQDLFDQINLMTYDQAGRWIGPHTWHNSSLYDNGQTVLRPGTPYPSVQARLNKFLDAGVRPAKLSIGTAFYGFVWKGATGPAQDVVDNKAKDIPYRTLMEKYYTADRYKWDDQAHAPYLAIDSDDASERLFISYDDERLEAEKVQFARDKGLGGIMIWELGQEYRRNLPVGNRNPLLTSIARANGMIAK